MTVDEGQEAAEKFLEEHMNDNSYFADGEPLLVPQYVSANEAGDGLEILFGITESQDEDDPELHKLAKVAFEALQKAHPDLPPTTWSIG
jgi:hypothetical protein